MMTNELKEKSDLHGMTCFLNSLLREWHDYLIYQVDSRTFVSVSLENNREVLIALKRFSILGRHEYQGDIFYKKNENLSRINFENLLELICEKLRYFNGNFAPTNFLKFKDDVIASRDNIYRFLLHNCDINNNDFLSAEQGLLIGHNFHPTPKSRERLTVHDLMSYAPEFKAKFSMIWLLVDPDIFSQINAETFSDNDWLLNLFLQENPKNSELLKQKGKTLLPMPMHPWQWQYLQTIPIIKTYIEERKIITHGVVVNKWFATSSMRTLYRPDSPYMLKFSLNLKMTNSIRVLLHSEVSRGLQLHDVLSTDVGLKFKREFPNFHIITEPSYSYIKNLDGNPIESSVVVCRHNPFTPGNEKNKFMLATLLQDDPYGGLNILIKTLDKKSDDLTMYSALKNWFCDFLNIAIKPLIAAYVNYGIIMEAHQQNLIIELKDGFPVASYFRDCQDHAYSQYGYELYAEQVAGIKKYSYCVADKRLGCQYFVYQVILNTTFNVITTLAKSGYIHEIELINDLRDFIYSLNDIDYKDKDCLNHLIANDKLLHKCNFKFALTRINDNQVPFDPMQLYSPVPNLIKSNRTHSLIKDNYNVIYQRYFPLIDKTVTLRKFNIDTDLSIFTNWQKNKRVAKFWQLDKSDDEAISHVCQLLSDPYQLPIIIEFDFEPIGYAELYWAANDRIADYYDFHELDRGFHLLIGEDHFLGVNNTSTVFTAIMSYLYLENAQSKRIIVEPDKNNQRFIKYMQLIPGWQYLKEARLPEKYASIFVNQRENFMMTGVV